MKRVVALLMCTVMLLMSAPLSPLADYLSLVTEAYAAQTKLGSIRIINLNGELQGGAYHVYQGDTVTLTAVVFDSDGNPVTDGEIEYDWSSSNGSAAVIKENAGAKAVIKGLSKGEATVTVKASDGTDEITDSCKLSVKATITAISFDSTYKLMTVGYAGMQLTYIISPADAGNKKLSWTSSDSSICTVSDSGFVTAVSAGICDVTATAADGSGVSAKIQIIVSDGTSTVALDKEKIALRVGEGTETLKATCRTDSGVEYADAVSWSSSDKSVATVDDKGVVTPVSRGAAVITATSLDGSGNSAVCSVAVQQPVTGITLEENAVCFVNKTYALSYKILPEDANNKSVTWKSGNKSVATVDNKGVVTGVSAGTAEITVTADDGDRSIYATTVVKVEREPTGVNIIDSAISLHVSGDGSGTVKKLTVKVSPDDATNKEVIWTSDNKKVATVDENGNVKAVAGGTATITATTKSGNKKDTCTVTVTQDASGIEIGESPDNFYVGRVYTLEAEVLPSTATNKKVTWKSSDTSVVTVSDSGVIEGKKAGSAYITAATENGKEAKVKITVLPKTKVSKITLNITKTSIERTSGKKIYLHETVSPSNASDKSVKWSSSNPTVATVDSYGVVTPRKAGEVRITVTAKDGSGVSAYCTVTVIEPVTGISLNSKSLDLIFGETADLKATVSPSNASDKTVKWSTSNKNVATVSSKGVVTATGGGTAVITAKTADGDYSRTCTVTVTSFVTGIRINSDDLIIPLGEKRTVSATISPSHASNKGITWKSSNSSAAEISPNGTITAKEPGTAEITATSKDGGKKDIIKVQVIRPTSSVSLKISSITLEAGKKKTLEASVKPLTATIKTVKWKSSDKKVATVSSKGVVEAVGPGKATITCTATDGYASTKCKVTVTQPVTGLKRSSKNVTVKIGTPKKLKVTVLPENATNKNLIWSSADTKIAKISADGTVEALKKGKVKMTARTADGLHSTTITVTVVKPVKSVSLNKTSLTINVGKTSVLKASVKPSSASEKGVKWTSSDNDVAKVSSDGKVTAVSAGYAVITCTTKDGEKKAECSVRVKLPVKSVKLNEAKATLNMGDTLKLKATLKPRKPSNSSVEWTSSDSKIAKVSSKGVVTPVKPGKATITVTTRDGGHKAVCEVTVVRKLLSISAPEEKSVFLGETEKIKVKFTPSDATNKKLTWKSSDEKIATVSSKGVVTPVKKGTVKITAVSKDGKYKISCKVTVKTALKSVKINKTKLTLDAGETYSLEITRTPKKATESIIWTTSKRKVATVSQKGVITAVGRGTATITGITEHGDKVTCKVTVNQPVTGMKISKTEAKLYLGKTLKLKAGVLPSDANDTSYKWSTSDKTVATVKDGVVTPKKVGKVKITATSANGKKAVCTVTVVRGVESVGLNETEKTLTVGEELTLKAAVSPKKATEKDVIWSTGNKKVATVRDGVVTAVGEGETKITVKTVDGGFKAVCTVKCVKA